MLLETIKQYCMDQLPLFFLNLISHETSYKKQLYHRITS